MSFSSLTVHDILPLDVFLKNRPQKAKEIYAHKKDRRIPLGPDTTLYFESRETILWQIQEMLRVEKGGAQQLADELEAYAPLVPNIHSDGSRDLIATLMIEIADVHHRFDSLRARVGIENALVLHVGDERILATPVDGPAETVNTDRTASVHFIRFVLRADQVKNFEQEDQRIVLESVHPCYTHKTLLSDAQRRALTLSWS